MKVINSSDTINPFGGLNFIIEQLNKLGVDRLINKHFAVRSTQSKYSFHDFFYSLWSTYFCGGDCAEDLQYHLKPYLSKVPGFKVCSSDSLLRIQKKLKTDICEYTSSYNKVHQLCWHQKLSQLNIKLLKRLNLLSSSQKYTLDYDNVILENKKFDCRKTYRHTSGYNPAVSTIDNKVVHVEMRNGNTEVRYKQEDTLHRMFELLKSEGIHLDKFRADSGSYQLATVQTVLQYCSLFYIRARLLPDVLKQIDLIKQWKKVTINNFDYEIASIEFTAFSYAAKKHKTNPIPCRLVVTRQPRRDKQIGLFIQNAFDYQATLTNDFTNEETNILQFYNQRGKQEKEFDVMNNDFGWKRMPFSYLNENLVYLILMAMARNIYAYMINYFSTKLKYLSPTFRLKKFIFRFIIVPVKWIKNGRQNKLRLYSIKKYPT